MTGARHVQRAARIRMMAALAALGVTAAIASQFIGQSSAPHSELTGKAVLPGFTTLRTQAEEIRVTLADEAYSLLAGPDGWSLSGTSGYPIRTDRLNELASGLEELVWDAPRTRDPGKFNAIGLGDPREGGSGALVEIIGPGGEVSASLITGRKDEHIYARRPEDKQAFRVKGSLPPLYSAQAWLDLNILEISGDSIRAVRITDSTGASLYLRRNISSADRTFLPGPPHENYVLVNRLATTGPGLALTRLHPIGVKPASDLKTKAVARHITETHDGLEIDVQGWREADGYYLTLRAIEAGEGANRANAINQRTKGWAFRISEIDWRDFSPSVNSIARPPAEEAETQAD